MRRMWLWLTVILGLAASPVHASETLRVGAQSFSPMLGNPYGPIALPNALPLQAIFDSFTRIGPNGQVLPGLATDWSQETPTRWVFSLKADVTFSNGEPFDADAVIAAFDYLQTDEGRRDSVASLDMKTAVVSFGARDPLTVEIETAEPDPILPLHLSFIRIPAPRHWQDVGRVEFQRAPVGTGPFYVDSWTTSRLELSAFEKSWRSPKVDRISMLQIKDPTARLQAFMSEAVDIAFDLAPEDGADVETIGGRLLSRPAPLVNFLLFVTTKDTPLKDVRVRRALNYAANKTQLLTAFFADAVPPASQFSHPMAFGFDPTLPPYPYDSDRAKALLDESGYADGFEFTMLIDPSRGGSYADWFQQLAQDFSAVGVTMTIRATTAARMIESVQTGDWPAEAFAWTFAGFDSIRGYRFRSCNWRAPYHCDPAMIPLIESAHQSETESARLATTHATLAYERDNPPGVLLWQGVGFDGVARQVSEFIVEQDFVRWDRVRVTD